MAGKQLFQLNPGSSMVLPGCSAASPALALNIEAGVGRVSAGFGALWPDVSLAFCGAGAEPSWIGLWSLGPLQLEALTPLELELEPLPECPVGADLIAEWLLHLHLVRHPVLADRRLLALLRLLIQQFGVRVPRGYRLPVPLGHGRVAELIGVTRSTVTRQFTLLRQQGLLSTEPSGTLLALPGLIEDSPWPAEL